MKTTAASVTILATAILCLFLHSRPTFGDGIVRRQIQVGIHHGGKGTGGLALKLQQCTDLADYCDRILEETGDNFCVADNRDALNKCLRDFPVLGNNDEYQILKDELLKLAG